MTVAEDLASRESLTDLPSNFQVYDSDECKIRPFTAGEVRRLGAILRGASGLTLRDDLKDVVNETISLDANNITRGDFWYMLAWLRINTFRNAPLTYSWTCPKDHKNNIGLILTELKLVELDSKFKEPAYLKLRSGEEIPLKLRRMGDEAAAVQYLTAMIPSGIWEKHEQMFIELCCTIDKFDTLHDKVDYLKAIEETPTGTEDLFMIEDFHRSFSHGLPVSMSATCGTCKHVAEVPLPFSFRNILPYGAYGEYIRDSVRFGEAPAGDSDK